MEKQFKREFREQTPETKKKISAALKGKQKSSAHRQNISKGLKTYWKDVPSRSEEDRTTIDDLI